jgi:hypothetical protein
LIQSGALGQKIGEAKRQKMPLGLGKINSNSLLVFVPLSVSVVKSRSTLKITRRLHPFPQPFAVLCIHPAECQILQ